MADSLASLIARSDSMDFFLWGHVKEHVYAVPHTTTEELLDGLNAAVKTASANTLRHIREMAVRSAAIHLEMDGCHFEHLL